MYVLYCPIVVLDFIWTLPLDRPQIYVLLNHSRPGLYLDIASREALDVCISVYVAFMGLLHHAFHL